MLGPSFVGIAPSSLQARRPMLFTKSVQTPFIASVSCWRIEFRARDRSNLVSCML